MHNDKGRKKHGSVKRTHTSSKKQQLTLSELQSRFEIQNNISGESTDSSVDGTILTPTSTSTPDSVSNAQTTPPTSNSSSSATSTATAQTTAKMSRTQMKRKQSSPMAPAFMVSAPGKVIVFGEHAVVHGKAALAAAISLRSYLLVTTLSKSHRTVTLNFRDIGLDHTWDIDSLPWNVFKHPSKKKMYYDLVTELDPDLVAAVQPHAAAVSTDKPDDVRKIHQSSAAQFLYLFLSLGSPESHAAIYTLRSTIPIGAGLGSSASVSVCLSAALLLQIRTLAGPHPDQPPEEAEVQIERINRWAFVGEIFCRRQSSPFPTERLQQTAHRNTIKQIPRITTPAGQHAPIALNGRRSRQVGRLRETHPEVTEAMLDTIDKVTMSASEMIKESDFEEDEEALEEFGALFRINHGLLVSLGVSHPRLERIRELVDYANIGWTKLTGAGGGGCAITLIRPDATPETLKDLEAKLAAENFEKFETTLGGDGVGVLYPAVLRNGSNEEGGEEIDQQKFENAVGMEGIDKLVGTHSTMQERREGWKFWKRAGGWTK
uniref:mevalonate kinase n=1 Tax=Talaromyces marneffei PM1 TaxID=1077442 RepID=A0A093V0K8_TALMA